MAGLPPLQLQVGTREILLDDTRRVAGAARAAGVVVEEYQGRGLIHVWPVIAPAAPESAEALTRMAGFVQRHWR
jgi:acetyl esterase/lipase